MPEPVAEPVPAPVAVLEAPAPLTSSPPAAVLAMPRGVFLLLVAVVVLSLLASGLLWQKLSAIQEQLARQSADAGAVAVEARGM
ncbi:MAG: hypothetical protein H7332_17250, partial [Bdellovibrionales bacterium]|nr:hypothetical protein [Ramlibacter sp.]